jgi:hypothetical protein
MPPDVDSAALSFGVRPSSPAVVNPETFLREREADFAVK